MSQKNSFPSFFGQRQRWIDNSNTTRINWLVSPLLSVVRKSYRQMAWSRPTGRRVWRLIIWRSCNGKLVVPEPKHQPRAIFADKARTILRMCISVLPRSATGSNYALKRLQGHRQIHFKCSLSTTPAFSRHSVSEVGFISFFRWHDTVRTYVTLVWFSYGAQRKRSL